MLCVPVCEYARNNLSHLRTFTITTTRKVGKRKENITMAGNSNPQAQMAGLKGILRWTLEQQARGGDGTTESKEVTEEDRAWLREAMENMIDTTDDVGAGRGRRAPSRMMQCANCKKMHWIN